MWMRWCRDALSDGVWFARRVMSGQASWPARFLGLSGSQTPGVNGGPKGRRAAIAERPLGLEWRPGNLRGANHTITDVTGRTNPAPPRSSAMGRRALPDGALAAGVAEPRPT